LHVPSVDCVGFKGTSRLPPNMCMFQGPLSNPPTPISPCCHGPQPRSLTSPTFHIHNQTISPSCFWPSMRSYDGNINLLNRTSTIINEWVLILMPLKVCFEIKCRGFNEISNVCLVSKEDKQENPYTFKF
jgi:hypothetical protein